MLDFKSSFAIIASAALLIILAILTRLLSPVGAQVSFITGLVGGVLCVVLGAASLRGFRTRAWTILVLVGTTFIFLSQTVMSWASGGEAGSVPGLTAIFVSAMFLVSMGLLTFLAYSAPTQAPEES